jgi:hypothetical protein
MSTDFKKVSILDDRLMTTDSLNYGVFRGGQNVTNVRMPAISSTSNSLNFVVPFPSESTVLDREVYIRTETDYIFSFITAAPGEPIYDSYSIGPQNAPIGYQCPLIYGYNISVAAFPTQRTFSTVQVQLNNNINTINTSDVLPALLRCSDVLDWEKNNMCASSVDRIAMVADEVTEGINNNVSSYDLVQGNKSIGNGSFNNQLFALVDDDTPVPYLPSGGINVLADANTYTAAGTRNFLLRVTSTEPLVAPPFIWNKTQSNCAGIYGLQNFSIVANYGSLFPAIKLSWTSGFSENGPIEFVAAAPPPMTNNTRGQLQTSSFGTFNRMNSLIQNVRNAELQLKYITPHGTDVKPLRNVIPLLEYPRFITSGLGNIGNARLSGNNGNSPVVPVNVASGVQGQITPTSATYASQTYTLNQVPDKLIIFVRPDTEYRNTPYWNDWALPITNITIQWNNHAGILANASQEQLFHMSKEAGSNQDFLSFVGRANVVSDRFAGMVSNNFLTLPIKAEVSAPQEQVLSKQGQAAPQSTQVCTIGSYLILDMAKHLELQEPFYAPGSLGSFQLQFNVTVENYQYSTPYAIGNVLNPGPGPAPEIVVIPVNSGIMVTEKGQTSCYSGILTKSDVLDAALQEPYGQMEIKRIVGHGHGDSGRALPKRCHPQHKNKTHVMPDGSRMENRLM